MPPLSEPIDLSTRTPIQISPHLKLQQPLSRRGNGPGLILVLDHYAQLESSPTSLDPAPLVKWAEEGYAVAQVLVPGSTTEDGGEFPLQVAIDALKGMKECDVEEGGGFGVILYLNRVPFYVEQALCLNPTIKAIISYGGKKIHPITTEGTPTMAPQLLHISGPEEEQRKGSFSVVPEDSEQASATRTATASEATIKTFRYLSAKKDSNWILPSDPSYDPASATLAHTRSLTFLKPLLNGPYFDLEAIWEEHCYYEFEARDVEATMATMVSQPYVNNIPTMTGGIGKERLTAFYRQHFIFTNPEAGKIEVVSRTVGIDRVIDEFVYGFEHVQEVDWLLPGIPPTNLHLQIPFTSVVNLRGDRLCHEHISWDQSTALKQLGLLPDWVPFRHAIDGREAARGKRFEVQLPVVGAAAAAKLRDEGSEESNALIERCGGRGWREVDDDGA